MTFVQQVRDLTATLPASFPIDPARVMVGLDIDGTIMRPRGVSKRVRDTWESLNAAGVAVVIATGRGIPASRLLLEDAGVSSSWAVCSNGAILAHWDGRELTPVTTHLMDPRPAIRKALTSFTDVTLAVETSEGEAPGYLANRSFAHEELAGTEIVVSDSALLEVRATTKLVVRAPALSREGFAVQLDRAMSERGWRTGASPVADLYEYSVGWSPWADFGPKGRTKATGLAELAHDLQIPSSGTVMVGDGDNDLPAFDWAGHAVAMGQASAHVRARADAVTGTLGDDGAAAIMQAILRHVGPGVAA